MSEAIVSSSDNATWWSKGLLIAAAIVVVGLPLSALGYRWDLWGLGFAFTALRYLFYFAIAALASTLVGGGIALVKKRRKDVVTLAHALVMVAVPALFVLMQFRAVQGVPPIHDITTDGANPPMFSGLVEGMPERSLEYEDVYAQQQSAYPDIESIASTLSVADAYAKALAAAAALGWEIAREDQSTGLFEAVDTTFWFGFKDDVIIRVSERGDGTMVDVCSVSRICRSDLGKNADRIREFVKAFES
ncbi:MAG: DUF1499 domain-containing protein [Pseudomonadales bacterium]